MLRLLILFILPSLGHAFDVLPEVFSWSEQQQQQLCSDQANKNPSYWRQITANKIESLLEHADERALLANSYVTLSYEALFRDSPKSEFASSISYVYSNASHHLGRLVRYSHWPEDSQIGIEDSSFIRGNILQIAVVIAPKVLSKKLMEYSLDLYKELAWSLSAAAICGDQYASNLVVSDNLRKAYNARSIDEFIYYFVAHEQSYLQTSMYQDPMIKLVAQMGILDKMRFITFNGELQASFYDWCKQTNCNSTSLNLENRIAFDRFAIEMESKATWWEPNLLSNRLENTQANIIANMIIEGIND